MSAGSLRGVLRRCSTSLQEDTLQLNVGGGRMPGHIVQVEEGEAIVDTALLVVLPALFHTVPSVVVSMAEALVAVAHHVFLSVVVASHSFHLRRLTCF